MWSCIYFKSDSLISSNEVFLLGHIHDASRYLKALDIFSLTSITEALAYAILEAGSAGLPVIASNVGGIPEVIENMKSGVLVEPKNSNEIKNELMYLIKNRQTREAFGKELEKTVKEKFNQREMIEKTLHLYH